MNTTSTYSNNGQQRDSDGHLHDDYIEKFAGDELPASDVQDMEQHISDCEECLKKLADHIRAVSQFARFLYYRRRK